MDQHPNIIITGAANGLGRALALACAGRGARVILLDKDLRGLESACDAVEAAGGAAPGYCQVDLSVAGNEALEQLVDELSGAYGGIDGLVHCAVDFQGLQPLDQMAPEKWSAAVQVNLAVPWFLTRCCLPALKQSDFGTVVFVLDEPVAQGKAYWGSYGVCKAGLRALANMFDEELEGTAVTVHAVDPGPMRTALRANAYIAEDPAAQPDPAEAAAAIADLLPGTA